MYSASPPSVISPMMASRSHKCTWWRLQNSHSPQWISVSTATRSPIFRSVIALPSRMTVPTNSWPMTIGAWRPVIGLGRSAGGMNSGPCVYSSRSVPQMPHHAMRSLTSSGAGASGSGNSSMRMSCLACHTAAFMSWPSLLNPIRERRDITITRQHHHGPGLASGGGQGADEQIRVGRVFGHQAPVHRETTAGSISAVRRAASSGPMLP